MRRLAPLVGFVGILALACSLLLSADAQQGSVNAWIQDRATGARATVSATPPGGAGTGLYVHCISGCSGGGGGGGTSSNFGAAFPAAGTAAGFSDGSNMQGPRVFDADSGGGTQYVAGAILRKSASGGSVEAGTSSDPLRVDPTGSTTQPVSGTVAATQSGAWSVGRTWSLASGTDSVAAVQSGAWSLSANQSVNVNQFGGSAVVTGTGTGGAGIPRVTVSNDSTVILGTGAATIGTVHADGTTAHDAAAAGVNPVLTGCYASAAAPSDVSADNDATREWCLRNGARSIQTTYAGVLASTGTGTSGTGTPRVILTTDSALAANQSVNLNQIAGAAASTAASGVLKVGVVGNAGGAVDAASGAAPPANRLATAGLASGATGGFLLSPTVCDSFANVTVSTATTTLLVTGVSGRHVRLCSLSLVTAAANNVAFISGTGATCGTGTTGMSGGTTSATGWNFAANGGLTQGSGLGEINRTNATGDSVCVITSAATQLSGRLSYTIY